jgi:uncharacterized protein (TIGR00251 family)
MGSCLDVPLHVQPRAGRNETAGLHGTSLKLRVASPPVDDAANQAVIAYFASRLRMPKSTMKIVSGRRSRSKTLRIEGLNRAEFLARFGMEHSGR